MNERFTLEDSRTTHASTVSCEPSTGNSSTELDLPYAVLLYLNTRSRCCSLITRCRATPIETEQVQIMLTDAPKGCHVCVERIDHAHANAERLWREAGAPEYLSVLKVENLQEASLMLKEPHRCEYMHGILNLDISLPPHAVAAITVEFAPEQAGGGVQA